MKKRIVICADGTWNRPEEDLEKDFPTNILRIARAIESADSSRVPQHVFYDWGVGSYYGRISGGATGKGLHKNIMDNYRYIVKNYSPGDELFLFGFSRGAYTVRSLCGLINNCGILKRPDANLIQTAFKYYKRSSNAYKPDGQKSVDFRIEYSHPSREIEFVGVFDTVGAMGSPISFLGLFEDKDEFYDTKLGRNVRFARHALAIDEIRRDFVPTVWVPREGLDIKQVWFAGTHSDVGGSQEPDEDGSLLSDIPLDWMMREAGRAGLVLEPYLRSSLQPDPSATLHPSRRHFYRLRDKLYRPLEDKEGNVLIHEAVKTRWDLNDEYRPRKLDEYVKANGWPALVK